MCIIVGVFAAAWSTTPRIVFGQGLEGVGYGFDWETYGVMTERFAENPGPLTPPLCFRFVVPMLVHYLGLGTFRGYFVGNSISFVAGCVLAYRLARHFQASRGASLLIAYGFAVLKMGLKFSLYYPVQMDAAGTALLMAITYATVRRAHVSWMVLMSVAVGVRENLALMAGFYILHELRHGMRVRELFRIVAVVAVPAAALLISRVYPVFPPYPNSRPTTTTLAFWVNDMLASPSRQAIWVMAYVNAFGMLLVPAGMRALQILRFHLAAPEWAYLASATLALSIIGGADVDRFAHWLAPVAVAVSAVLSHQFGPLAPTRTAWAHWLLLHAAGTQLVTPWFASEAFYRTRWALTCTADAYYWMSLNSAVVVAVALAMICHTLAARSSLVRGRGFPIAHGPGIPSEVGKAPAR